MADASYRAERSIALVGLMGAGKSTIGRRLAKRLGLPFVDADAEIAAAAGLGIAEIFARHGEARFRDDERRMLAQLVEGPPQVIATGGGAFVDAETRALILERCTAVWLDAEAAVLAGRVGRRPHRPLLSGKDPLASLEALAAARNPAYAEAHLKVPSGALSREQIVDRIVEALAGR